MKSRLLFLALGSLLIAGNTPAADSKKEARVTQIIREVEVLPANNAERAAVLNDRVAENTGVRTGSESRSELTFVDQTITRLGANTVFSFTKAGRNAEVDSGSILLRVPKESGGGRIRSSAVTVAVTGTTLILESTRGGPDRLYVLEGRARISLVKYPKQIQNLHSAQMVDVPAGATSIPPPTNFDLNDLMKKHPLITDFPPLPSQGLIADAARQQPPPQQTSSGPSIFPVLPVIGVSVGGLSGEGDGLCWVCISHGPQGSAYNVGGQVSQIPATQARKRHAQCYGSEEQARAHCKGTVWCCMDGQVVQLTEEECRARGGQAFRSERQARTNCGEGGSPTPGPATPTPTPGLCWVCIDGQVSQIPATQARKIHAQCYGSEEQARAHCKKKDHQTCWACVNGKVTQLAEEKARARGLQCFSSREEATSNCRPDNPPGKGPHRPPTGPGKVGPNKAPPTSSTPAPVITRTVPGNTNTPSKTTGTTKSSNAPKKRAVKKPTQPNNGPQ